MTLEVTAPPTSAPSPFATYRFGPTVDAHGTSFRLWAPSAVSAEVLVDGRTPLPMQRVEDGFWTAYAEHCGPGAHYKFRVGDLTFPDIASRQQETDTDGWSIVRAPLEPSKRKAPIRPWHETVICEVHVGTVTQAGTFNALRDQLEHFRDAGYTCLEIMPINEFPGRRNWGYDGTLVCAPDGAYGTPEELRALVDRAHELGLCLILDVVYNHFGETHNFPRSYVPEWFADEVETPWGPGINFEEPMVRQFFYENAVMWLREYDFDGLRFDSVHEMKTGGRDTFLGELAEACVQAKPHAKLIIENMKNSFRWLERDARNEPMTFTAQWNDDMHHVLDFIVTGDGRMTGYGAPEKDPYADLEKALADGFVMIPAKATRAMAAREVARPPNCRRIASSPTCRTTTRLAIASMASACRTAPVRKNSTSLTSSNSWRPRSRSASWAMRATCVRLSHSSSISPKRTPGPSATTAISRCARFSISRWRTAACRTPTTSRPSRWPSSAGRNTSISRNGATH